MSVRFLGTGAAEPIPAPGCTCSNCMHALTDPTAHRAQSGMALLHDDGQYVVDCGPAVVAVPQWLNAAPLKAVFISHLHPDHALGLYSIRWVQQETPVPTFLPPDTDQQDSDGVEHEIVRLENWLKLNPTRLDYFSAVTLDGLTALSLELSHGDTPTQGFLFELEGVKVAYLIDGKGLPPKTASVLSERGRLDCIVVDATYRPGTHGSRHNSVDEAIELGLQSGARRVVLTHIGHQNLSKPELEAYVHERTAVVEDQAFICAYDGLTIALFEPESGRSVTG